MGNDISKLVSAYSIREIAKMNIFLSLLISVFAVFFLTVFHEPTILIFGMTLKSGCYIGLTSFTLLYILRYCSKKFQANTSKFRIVRYCTSFLCALIIQFIIWPFFAFISDIQWEYDETRLIFIFTSEALIMTTLILMLQDFALVRHGKSQTELENSRLQLRNAEAENLLLKQQIHPHFLFNSLNTLKALIKKDPNAAESYLIQLADFLRAAVSENNTQATTLEEELKLCKNYMEMQKIRFGTALSWDLIIDNENMLKGFVPSFSLQPLLENAIKHNIFTKESPLKIMVRQHDSYISISNAFNHRNAGELSIKSGLVNLAERYLLWSGEEIIIKNDGVIFSVSLKIMMHENNNN
ncbi:histidine kinase [Flavobacterium zepuense]|uniref:Histidine kinase n=1 Tax=Flavobacterium zepuense TaxID=2593302 RepID=A0A552V9R5_9FLAO|nr:histidine kinase [Flavobacterium zepuense]TRW27214.1 histidine kinase [Flavobacterium zepuense]